jgi:hypothetical protein
MIVAASVVALPFAVAAEAEAACERLAFLVNDYGKDVPTRDSQSLLDKHIAKWTAERGIKQYKTGPKDVHCELFLNFIVFDEYTCQAEATVCWGGEEPPGAAAAAAPGPAVKSKAPAKASAKAQPVAASSVKSPAAAKATTPKAAPVAKSVTPVTGESTKQ